MKTIQIEPHQKVALCSGRRLLVENGDRSEITNLPRSAVTLQKGRGGRHSVTFGTIGRATLQVVGPPEVVDAIFDRLVDMEQVVDIIQKGSA